MRGPAGLELNQGTEGNCYGWVIRVRNLGPSVKNPFGLSRGRLEKMFISLQAGQNFPPAGQISLQCGMVSCIYFFIFSLKITKFLGKELIILPVNSMPVHVESFLRIHGFSPYNLVWKTERFMWIHLDSHNFVQKNQEWIIGFSLNFWPW